MTMLLTIAASTMVTLLVFVALLRYALPAWVRRRAATQAGTHQRVRSSGIAATVTFEPIDADARRQQPRMSDVVAQFHNLGYISAGRFRVPEIATMEVQFATNADGTCVAVYDHSTVPTFFDVVRTATNQTANYVTSSPLFDPANTPPGCVAVGDPDLSPAQAVDILADLQPTGDLLPATAENVCALSTAAYERQVAHILTRSAPTVEQMREVSDRFTAATGAAPLRIDDKSRRLAAQIHQRHREQALSQLVVQEFLRTGTYSAEAWERVRDRIVIVHERMSEADRAAALPDPSVATVVGRLERPVAATVYLLPR